MKYCLVRQIYAVAAREARTRGVHFLRTLVVEPNRDHRLGRNEEGYSEDPYLCSQIVEAVVHGMQGEDISANDMAISEKLLTKILREELGFNGLFDNPYVGVDRAVRESKTKESRELALQTAREGIVLLKNDKNLLPLNKNIKSIAVIGTNADFERNQLGDYTSQTVTQDVVTVLEGIRNKVSPQTKVNYVKGCEIIGNQLNEINKAILIYWRFT